MKDYKDMIAPDSGKIHLIGHMIDDPEKGVGPSGKPFALFMIAGQYADRDPNGPISDQWAVLPCLLFGEDVGRLMERKKGTHVIVSGRLRSADSARDTTRIRRLYLVCERLKFGDPIQKKGLFNFNFGTLECGSAEDRDIPF